MSPPPRRPPRRWSLVPPTPKEVTEQQDSGCLGCKGLGRLHLPGCPTVRKALEQHKEKQ